MEVFPIGAASSVGLFFLFCLFAFYLFRPFFFFLPFGLTGCVAWVNGGFSSS